jgi:hypothetical protein
MVWALSPVSLVLVATWARSYVDGVMATRYRGSPTSRAASEAIKGWVAFFAEATRAVKDASGFEQPGLA